MVGARAETFLQVMYRIEYFTLERVWTALTDEEFFWEPAPSSWSIRRRDDGRSRTPLGSGDWVADFEVQEPTPTPMTTIAWLLWHVGSVPGRLTEIDLLGGTHSIASGWTSPYLTDHPIFINAADATSTLREGWAALRSVIERTPDVDFELSSSRYTYANALPASGLCVLGPPGPEHPGSFFVAGVLNEVSHHGSQICCLRDLYAARTANG